MRIWSRIVRTLCLFVLALGCAGAGLATAEERVALVVGNSSYRNVPQLPNPANDAGDVAAAFTRLGFKVELIKDAGFDDLRRALIGFGAKARDADMAVVYFAGHGMEIAGENWAVPVDAALLSDADIESEAIGLKSLTLAVSGARGLGLVILDACRNNPFDSRMQHATRTRAVSRGLAPIEPSGNVLVAFAAKDGTTATDGDGRNSPFTAALLSHIETPGLEVDFLFRNIRDDVLAATQGRQQPFAYGSLSREAVYLKPGAREPGLQPTLAADEVAWPYVKVTSDLELVRRFTAQFPTSRHRADADQRTAVLEAAAASALTETASPASSPASGEPGVNGDAGKSQPQTATLSTPEQIEVARQFNGASPQVEKAWALIKTGADPALLRRFTAEFPSRDRQIVSAALNGIGSSTGILRQLHAEEMHAVLADYGRFVQHPRYGEVWVPGVTPAGWHPYEPCRWVRTRQFDWFYLDRTAWGAIVHHYGRWAHDDQLGWIWSPGVDFSPGWVLWRTAPQQVGWAPMPPASDVPTVTAAQLDTAAYWTFMDQTDFTRGCGAVRPAAPALAAATPVRELKIVAGMPVVVLPVAIAREAPDVDVAFDPWPAWLVSQAIVDWNKLWALAPAVCLPAANAPAQIKQGHPPLPAFVPPPLGAAPDGPAGVPAKIKKQQQQQQQAKKAPPAKPVSGQPFLRRRPVMEDRSVPVTFYRHRPSYPVQVEPSFDPFAFDRRSNSGHGGGGSSAGSSGSSPSGSASSRSSTSGATSGGSSTGGSTSGGTSGGGSTGGGTGGTGR